MGCSSSALNKAGDGSRLRSEESESCLAQPKPRMLGKESSALHGKVQKESPPPVEKLKISAVSRANGVKSLWEQPLANDAADPPGPTADTQPLEGPEESGPLQPGGKDDTPGAEEKNDIEAMTEAQSLKGNAETESLGRDTKYEPLQITGERDSPGAVDATETPQTAREMSPIRTAEKVPPQEAAGEPQPQEAMGKAEQTQLPETAPKENERPETLEGGQFVEMAEERQLQEALGKDEHSQLLETVPRENDETPEVLEESQFVETAGNNDLLHKTPEGLGNMEQIQPEGIVGSVEHPAGTLETGADMEMVIHTNGEDQHIEGETGEKVETEMENENISDGTGTKEEETGEAVDLSAAL